MAIRKVSLQISLCLAIACFGAGARADVRSHRQAVDELMRQVRVETLLAGWRQRLDTQAIELINDVLQGQREADISPAQKASVEKFSQSAKEAVDSALAWDTLRDGVAKIYMDRFSESEVRALLTFYRSPVGQKWVGQTAEVSAGIEQLIQMRVKASVPEFKRLGRELRSDYVGAQGARQASVPVPAGEPPTQAVPAINPKTGR